MVGQDPPLPTASRFSATISCINNIVAYNAVVVTVGAVQLTLTYKSLFTEENGSTQKHSSESINTNKAKTAKTATKSITV